MGAAGHEGPIQHCRLRDFQEGSEYEMTTTRERKEAKAGKLRAWATKREANAQAALADPRRHDHAFNTQPGHIPERARVIAREDRAFESLEKAENMTARADGIERQLKGTIYSDDPDALDAIAAKIAKLEGKQAMMKAINAAFRKGDEAALEALGVSLNELRAKMTATPWERSPFPPYALTGASSEIRRLKERANTIGYHAERTIEAEEAGGVIVKDGGAAGAGLRYVVIRHAGKPAREILTELKAAGFWWGAGQWTGYTGHVPERYASIAPCGRCGATRNAGPEICATGNDLPDFAFCALHNAAPALLAALQAGAGALDMVLNGSGRLDTDMVDAALSQSNNAITQARGES